MGLSKHGSNLEDNKDTQVNWASTVIWQIKGSFRGNLIGYIHYYVVAMPWTSGISRKRTSAKTAKLRHVCWAKRKWKSGHIQSIIHQNQVKSRLWEDRLIITRSVTQGHAAVEIWSRYNSASYPDPHKLYWAPYHCLFLALLWLS
jgi:hypothetical protein